MLFKFQCHVKKGLLDLALGPGLSWTCALSEIKIMYSHIVIHMLVTTVIKDDKLKNLALLRVLLNSLLKIDFHALMYRRKYVY